MTTIKALKLPPVMRRFVEIEEAPAADMAAKAIEDAKAREWHEEEFRATFATEAPVMRFFGREVLGMRADEVDLGPLMRAGSILRNHDVNQPVGIPIEAGVGDGAGRVRFRFANTARGREAYEEVKAGAIRGLSVGYSVERFEMADEGDEKTPPTFRAVRWAVHEISVTPTPADSGATFGRAAGEDLAVTVPVVYTRGAESHQEVEPMADTPQAGNAPAPTPAPAAVLSADDVAEIRLLARGASITAEATMDMLASGKTADALRAEIRATAKATRRDDTNTPRATGGENREAESLVAAIPDALAIMSGAMRADGTAANGKQVIRPHERAAALASLKPSEMLRMYAEANGVRTFGRGLHDIAKDCSRRAFRAAGYNTTSDFPVLLENTLNKILLISYQSTPTTFEAFSRIIPANDLRDHPLYKDSDVEGLGQVGESGEVRSAVVPDGKKEVLQMHEWARKIALTDKLIINDDLDSLRRIPTSLGRAARSTVNRFVWYLLLANGVTNEDGVAFFDATHNNLITSGVGSGPSVAALDAVTAALENQVDHLGNPIRGTAPAVVVVAPGLKGSALSLLNSTVVPGGTNDERNRYNGAFVALSEPLLNTAGSYYENTLGAKVTAAGNPAHWFAFSDPAIMPAVTVAFYGGDTPQVEEGRELGVLGMEYQAVLRFGACLSEWRAAVKYQNHSVG
jgi:HK97 family phage prohead protease